MEAVYYFLPLLLIVGFAILTMLMEVTTKNKELIGYTSIVGIFLSLLSVSSLWNKSNYVMKKSFFDNMIVIDNYSLFFYTLFFVCGIITIFTGINYLKRENIEHGEFYSLILFAISGMMIIASANDLLLTFIGIEVMSIAIYVLVGFNREKYKSTEASLKYFFMGAFSSGFILYGIALLYGSTGSTNFTKIANVLKESIYYEQLTIIGLLFLLIGLFFKVSAVPFHLWSPDAYEGAPAPITGFMISSVKAASFAIFLKLFLLVFIDLKDIWQEIIIAISIISMFVGNIFAFSEKNIKRMLAYSSISHTGYLLIGIASLTPTNSVSKAILYYLVAYSIANLGLFAFISHISNKDEKYVNIEDFSGIGFKYPLIGITMSILMVSMVGLPPTSGFFGKYYLFSSALNEGLFYLVLIGIINSILSVYYYLRVVVVMYLKKETKDLTIKKGKLSLNLVMIYTAACTLWIGLGTFTILGIVPGIKPLMEWANASIMSIL